MVVVVLKARSPKAMADYKKLFDFDSTFSVIKTFNVVNESLD